MTYPDYTPLPDAPSVGARFGPKRVKHAMRDYLRYRLPVTLAYLRPLWGVDPDPVNGDVPDPVSWMRNPPLALDLFPRIAVQVTRMPQQRRTEQGDDGEWAVQYAFTIFAWCKADADPVPTGLTRADDHQRWEAVIDQRDLLMAAVRYTVLNGLHLGVQPAGTFGVDEDSLVEDYTDPAATGGDRWVAGGTLTGRVRVFETIEGTRIGTVREIDVDVVAQPPDDPQSITDFQLSVHPALQ